VHRSRSPFNRSDEALSWALSDNPSTKSFHQKEEKMSIKDLLVTFVTSEEASITQRSALRLGALLPVVMLVAMAMVAMMPMSVAPVWAGGACCQEPNGEWGCSGSMCGPVQSVEACGGAPCYYQWRDCYEDWTEWRYQCPGWQRCYCP